MDINNLLKLAADNQASDIHLLSGQPPILRIDGELVDLNQVVSHEKFAALTNTNLEIFIDRLLTEKQKTRFLEERDLDLGYQIDTYRYRLNFAYEKNNISIVARIISDQKQTLEEIGMPPIVEELLKLTQGFILVTGPTGCGKSTSLAAMINHLNSHYSYNIVTLEDPIEYIFSPEKSIISQRQLGTDMLTFNSGLKHVLRQDPNIIMLGEMRDLETISAAVTLAETGHLVLATLHTYSAAQTIDRIIDSFPPYQQNQIKSQLSNVLSAVISQRLLPRQQGGRIATREILINNKAVANLIREGKLEQIESIIETGSSQGMITMDKHLKELYQAGEISREVAERNIENINILNS